MRNRFNGLEEKRVNFFQIGLVCAMALALIAFEWRTEPYRVNAIGGPGPVEEEVFEHIPITKSTPKPPPLRSPLPPDPVKELPDEAPELPDKPEPIPFPDELPGLEGDEPEVPDAFPRIFEFPAKYPEFKGGERARLQFMADNLRYPRRAKNLGISGTVVVEFIVDKNGNVSDVVALNDPGGGLAEEAVRVVKKMAGRWNPGEQGFQHVAVRMRTRVKFSLRH